MANPTSDENGDRRQTIDRRQVGDRRREGRVHWDGTKEPDRRENERRTN